MRRCASQKMQTLIVTAEAAIIEIKKKYSRNPYWKLLIFSCLSPERVSTVKSTAAGFFPVVNDWKRPICYTKTTQRSLLYPAAETRNEPQKLGTAYQIIFEH